MTFFQAGGWEMPATVERLQQRQSPPSTTFGTSWAFDFEAGDLVVSPAGRVVEVSGFEAWRQWCLFTVMTRRGRHAIYSSEHGADLDAALVALDRELAEQRAITEITDALREHSYTRSATVSVLDRSGDRLELFYSATSINGETTDGEVSAHG